MRPPRRASQSPGNRCRPGQGGRSARIPPPSARARATCCSWLHRRLAGGRGRGRRRGRSAPAPTPCRGWETKATQQPRACVADWPISIRLRSRRSLKRASLPRPDGGPGSWRCMTPPSMGGGCTGRRAQAASSSHPVAIAASPTQPRSRVQSRPGKSSPTPSRPPLPGASRSPRRGRNSSGSIHHFHHDGVQGCP